MTIDLEARVRMWNATYEWQTPIIYLSPDGDELRSRLMCDASMEDGEAVVWIVGVGVEGPVPIDRCFPIAFETGRKQNCKSCGWAEWEVNSAGKRRFYIPGTCGFPILGHLNGCQWKEDKRV